MSEEKTKQTKKMMVAAVRADIPTLLESLPMYPTRLPICIQGRAGIGKSETVAQVAERCRSEFYKDPENCRRVAEVLAPRHPTVAAVLKKHGATVWHYDFGVPMIMRRLAQTMEGDVTGVPRIVARELGVHGNDKREVTQFKSLDWVLDGVEFPVVLFLDERNRALDAVKQAVFEMLDSHGFNGHAFHDDTRVYIAENIGDDYQVQALDPAEISRTALIHLEPSVQAWLAWAKKACHPDIHKFIQLNQQFLEHQGTFEPNKKYPDRRAWKRLSDAISLLPKEAMKSDNEVLSLLVKSVVGMDAGFNFLDYLRKKSKEITAQQIIEDWEGNRANVVESNGEIAVEIYVDLAKKVSNWIKTNEIDPKHFDSFKCFIKECPPEPRTGLFTAILNSEKNKKYYKEFSDCAASSLGMSIDISKKAPTPKKK